jgi:hypothetical protein
VKSGCVGEWLDVIGHEGWCREEWEAWHLIGKSKKDLAGPEAFLGRTDVA